MRLVPLLLAAALLVPEASAQLTLSRLLGDGAVVQRNAPIAVWGTATPGIEVEIALGDDRATVRADAAGRWRASLPPRSAGGPFRLGVEAGGERIEASDVLVGDVWLASGQSNMEWPVSASDGAAAAVAEAGDRTIRHFEVPRALAAAPADTLPGGSWEAAGPETVADFSAVAYAFAQALREHHEVPIGIVNATWGGTRIEPWMTPAALDIGPEAVQEAFDAEAGVIAAIEARVDAVPGARAPDGDDPAGWASPDLDDSGWASVPVPALWEDAGLDGLDGVAWYRTTFDLTALEAAAGVVLGLGQIDDDDVTFVNGTEVGRMEGGWNVDRRYPVAASVLRAGPNVLAVRVTDHAGGGGIAGHEANLYLETVAWNSRSRRFRVENDYLIPIEKRSLAGAWRLRVEAVRVNRMWSMAQVPTALWNAMVHPVRPAAVAGVIWYQGESNAGTEADARAYRALFPALIEGWREAFEAPDLPFLWVQLAAFEATGHWPTLRASQSAALRLARTAEVVTLDVGDADDIHPRDKATVGRRLALAARQVVYGESLTASGPRYRSHTVRAGRVDVQFDHLGGGLATRDDAPLGGFEVAGTDGRWHDAEAEIQNDRVVVWSPAVPAPEAVRYAWADNPEAATLESAEGLPAAPFWAE
ncbi:MAG: sialate O-acetylesterase [Bacteroidota bacterium]